MDITNGSHALKENMVHHQYIFVTLKKKKRPVFDPVVNIHQVPNNYSAITHYSQESYGAVSGSKVTVGQ